MSEMPKQDSIGAYPQKFDVDSLPERRTAAFARMMAVVAVVEAFALVAMGFAIAALMPLQKVVPMVFSKSDKGDEIVHINPATLDSTTNDYVTEIQLRNYVEKKFAMVGTDSEQAINWGQGSIVQLMMPPAEYGKFFKDGVAARAVIRGQGETRTVRIDSVRKLNQDTWQVEYVLINQPDQNPQMANAATGDQHSWISTYRVSFSAKNVTYSDRLNNPFGMTITSQSDARRD